MMMMMLTMKILVMLVKLRDDVSMFNCSRIATTRKGFVDYCYS